MPAVDTLEQDQSAFIKANSPSDSDTWEILYEKRKKLEKVNDSQYADAVKSSREQLVLASDKLTAELQEPAVHDEELDGLIAELSTDPTSTDDVDRTAEMINKRDAARKEFNKLMEQKEGATAWQAVKKEYPDMPDGRLTAQMPDSYYVQKMEQLYRVLDKKLNDLLQSDEIKKEPTNDGGEKKLRGEQLSPEDAEIVATRTNEIIKGSVDKNVDTLVVQEQAEKELKEGKLEHLRDKVREDIETSNKNFEGRRSR